MSLEDLQRSAALGAHFAPQRTVTLLPDPEPCTPWATLVSVDDHVVEPPDAFAGRVEQRFADAAPRIVESDDGTQAWLWNDRLLPNVGFNAVVGRPVREHSMEPTRFDEMRRGAWDVAARLHDMDINGVWASVCFPSFLPGFVGQRLTLWPDDEDLAFAMMRAYNDWHLEAWCAADPDRFIPNQIPWLRDPVRAADEIRRNAARGFKAVTFTEAPHLMSLPSLHSGHWDPFFAACEETETVLCLHVGSSGTTPTTAPDAPPVTVGVLFFGYAMFAAVDWLYSKVPVRFPRIKICLSEGGIGWVAGLIDRIDHIHRHGDEILDDTWRGVEPSPSDVLRRNFWFCAIDDESSYANRHVIGVENILVESDYPHSDSTWPDTQSLLQRHLAAVPVAEQRRICWQNAVSLFRHPPPVTPLPVNPKP
jgi:predicted TIM-barrel fold metal-dependent hydrolase